MHIGDGSESSEQAGNVISAAGVAQGSGHQRSPRRLSWSPVLESSHAPSWLHADWRKEELFFQAAEIDASRDEARREGWRRPRYTPIRPPSYSGRKRPQPSVTMAQRQAAVQPYCMNAPASVMSSASASSSAIGWGTLPEASSGPCSVIYTIGGLPRPPPLSATQLSGSSDGSVLVNSPPLPAACFDACGLGTGTPPEDSPEGGGGAQPSSRGSAGFCLSLSRGFDGGAQGPGASPHPSPTSPASPGDIAAGISRLPLGAPCTGSAGSIQPPREVARASPPHPHAPAACIPRLSLGTACIGSPDNTAPPGESPRASPRNPHGLSMSQRAAALQWRSPRGVGAQAPIFIAAPAPLPGPT